MPQATNPATIGTRVELGNGICVLPTDFANDLHCLGWARETGADVDALVVVSTDQLRRALAVIDEQAAEYQRLQAEREIERDLDAIRDMEALRERDNSPVPTDDTQPPF